MDGNLWTVKYITSIEKPTLWSVFTVKKWPRTDLNRPVRHVEGGGVPLIYYGVNETRKIYVGILTSELANNKNDI